MIDPLISKVLGILFVSSLITFVFLFRRRSATQDQFHRILNYPVFLKLFSFVGMCTFLSLVIFLTKDAQKNEIAPSIGILSPFLILIALGFIEVWTFQIKYNSIHIIQRSLWSGETEIKINEISHMKYSNLTDQVYVYNDTNEKIRFSKLMNGYEELLHAIELVLPDT